MNDSDSLLKQIESQLQEVPDFGQLQIHVKKHVGKYFTDYVKMTSFKYNSDEPNIICTADIVKLIKQIADAGLDGSLSFGIDFKRGEADVMRVQDFKKL